MTLGASVTRTSIVVRTQFEGFHCWPDAPEEVKFLRFPHRHLFKVACHFTVKHNDRDLEFFIVQKAIKEKINLLVAKAPDNASCETMARFLLNSLLEEQYPVFKVTVSEDGENDAVVEIMD